MLAWKVAYLIDYFTDWPTTAFNNLIMATATGFLITLLFDFASVWDIFFVNSAAAAMLVSWFCLMFHLTILTKFALFAHPPILLRICRHFIQCLRIGCGIGLLWALLPWFQAPSICMYFFPVGCVNSQIFLI